MTTVESLKALYVKLGGKAEDVAGLNLIPECIDALNDVAGGGYDLVIRSNNENGIWTNVKTDYEVLSGDVEAIRAKVAAKEAVKALLYLSYEYSTDAEPYTDDQHLYATLSGVDVNYLEGAIGVVFVALNGSGTKVYFNKAFLVINADKSIQNVLLTSIALTGA